MERYWSRFAENFDEQQSWVAGSECIEAIREKLLTLKNLGRVLEFGCGNGRFTQCIVDSAEHVTATDYSSEMITQAQRFLGCNASITLEQADCHKTRFANSSFDTVFMANLIHIIDNPESVIDEAQRILKTSGQLIITSFTTEEMHLFDKIGLLLRYRKTFGAFPKGMTPFTTRSLAGMLVRFGFDIVETALLGQKVKSLFVRAKKVSKTENSSN